MFPLRVGVQAVTALKSQSRLRYANCFHGVIRQQQQLLKVRNMSNTFLKALGDELVELEEEGIMEKIDVESILAESPFDLKSTDGARVVLKNGNALVSFNAAEFEHSGGSESAVPMIVTLEHETSQSQLSLACIARNNDEGDEEEGELEIEHVVVEPLGGNKNVDKPEPYSPAIGELNDEMKTSIFEYLHSKGVDNDFASCVVNIASKREEQLYGEWLMDVKSFVEKEDA